MCKRIWFLVGVGAAVFTIGYVWAAAQHVTFVVDGTCKDLVVTVTGKTKLEIPTLEDGELDREHARMVGLTVTYDPACGRYEVEK